MRGPGGVGDITTTCVAGHYDVIKRDATIQLSFTRLRSQCESEPFHK